MSDMGELFNAARVASQEKRSANLESSVELLTNSGASFEKLSTYHYLVAGRYDFWPSTGLFIDRQTKSKSRGIFELLKIVEAMN
jgi:hypothetical protein